MVYLGNIISGIAWILDSALTLYLIVVIGSVVISWVNADPYNPIVRFLRDITDPAYRLIRRYIPFVILGGIDLSPIILIFAIMFCKIAVITNLTYLANQLKYPHKYLNP